MKRHIRKPIQEGDAEQQARRFPESPAAGDFAHCLAEAVEILAERAARHGLLEAAHLLHVAALAARESAPQPEPRPVAAASKRRRAPLPPA